jgi:hypothetical protein
MCRGLLGLLVNRCLETPRGYNPTVAPERFCDHEVIVKALRCVFDECGFVVVTSSSFVARSLAGWCVQCERWPCAPPRQDALIMWYTTAEICHVSVPCIGARDLGGAEWSR